MIQLVDFKKKWGKGEEESREKLKVKGKNLSCWLRNMWNFEMGRLFLGSGQGVEGCGWLVATEPVEVKSITERKKLTVPDSHSCHGGVNCHG